MSNISPKVDLAFKKIFGVEENKDLLISLINSIVSKEDQVSEITLLNPYNAQNFKSDKLSILDIKAKSVDGKHFNIEIQITDEADYDKRALYYWARLYTEQLEKGELYSTLSKAIGIHILNFFSIPETDKYHNTFHITEKETGNMYFKDLELHTIELNKFSNDPKEQLSDIVAKVKNSLDIWLAFLTRHELLKPDSLPQSLDNRDLKKALTVLDVMSLNSEERDFYEDHLKWLRVEASAIEKAEAKGIEKGIVKGREEGISIGEVKGKEKIAITMLKQNLNESLISQITGFSSEEILKLKNNTKPICN